MDELPNKSTHIIQPLSAGETILINIKWEHFKRNVKCKLISINKKQNLLDQKMKNHSGLARARPNFPRGCYYT